MNEIKLVVSDEHGEMFLIGIVEKYVVCRRKGCYPTIKTIKEWQEMGKVKP